MVEATSGACPICGEVFDELTSFSAHLAEEHDLHDDDGAASSFGTLLVAAAPAVPSAAMASDLLEGPPPRPAGPGDRGRPWGLVALVLVLALLFAGLVAFGPRPEDEDDEVAELGVADETTTTADAGGDGEDPAPPTTVAAGQTTTTAAGGGADPGEPPPSSSSSAPPTTASGGGGAAPPPTASPTTTTAPPPVTFVAPTTSGARIDACERVKNRWRITYSWRFDGGSAWRAPSAYTATGGGRYRHVVEVPRAGSTLIATVRVLDDADRSHDVALRPVLSSDAC